MSFVNVPGDQKICPFMSGRPIAVAMPNIVQSQGAQAVSTMMVACAKEKCALWDGQFCSLSTKRLDTVLGNVALGLTDVADGLRPFDAPSSGSPTTHLVEAIEGLIEMLRDRKPVPKTPN